MGTRRGSSSPSMNGRWVWLPRLFALAAIVVLLIGAGLSLQIWYKNKQATDTANRAIARANAGQSSPAASTHKPTLQALTTYTVAPSMPRYLIIPEIGVDARIYPAGLTRSGAIGTPGNVYDTAWYNHSSLPGQSGAMLIDGHVQEGKTTGVFYRLRQLEPGNLIEVERGDNKMLTYRVIKTQIYNANTVDMSAALSPIVKSEPGLNLITCAGDIVPGTDGFNNRLVVFAQQL